MSSLHPTLDLYNNHSIIIVYCTVFVPLLLQSSFIHADVFVFVFMLFCMCVGVILFLAVDLSFFLKEGNCNKAKLFLSWIDNVFLNLEFKW